MTVEFILLFIMLFVWGWLLVYVFIRHEKALEEYKEVLLDLQDKYVEMMDDRIFKVVKSEKKRSEDYD